MTYMLPDDDRPEMIDTDLADDDFRGGSIIAFDDLVFACANLCELLEIENEALESHDPETVRVLIENKVALVKLYEQSVAPLIKTPELAEALPAEQREELLAVGTRLNELIKTNAMRLQAEMEAYGRVIDLMAGATKKQSSTYGRAGTFDSANGPGAALSFNQSL